MKVYGASLMRVQVLADICSLDPIATFLNHPRASACRVITRARGSIPPPLRQGDGTTASWCHRRTAEQVGLPNACPFPSC